MWITGCPIKQNLISFLIRARMSAAKDCILFRSSANGNELKQQSKIPTRVEFQKARTFLKLPQIWVIYSFFYSSDYRRKTWYPSLNCRRVKGCFQTRIIPVWSCLYEPARNHSKFAHHLSSKKAAARRRENNWCLCPPTLPQKLNIVRISPFAFLPSRVSHTPHMIHSFHKYSKVFCIAIAMYSPGQEFPKQVLYRIVG